VRGHAADIDDRAVSGALQVRQAGLRAEKGAVEHAGEDAPPLGKRHPREWRFGADRGVIYKAIEAAELPDRGLDHRRHGAGVRDIGDVECRAAASRSDLRHGVRGVLTRGSCVHHHCGAARRQRSCDGASDIARPAGNQDNFAGKLACVRHGAIV